jgi:hypothetical protein
MIDLSDIYTKGFIKFEEKEGIDLIKLDEFVLKNREERSRDNGQKDVDVELNKRLLTFAFYLKEKYIVSEWPDAIFNKYNVWEGVDRDNQGWHTDMFEEYDVFFLYYFDDTFEETGGAIEFKWGILDNDEKFESFQPKSGDLFLVSNQRGFWHRAIPSKICRRVASFDFVTEKD